MTDLGGIGSVQRGRAQPSTLNTALINSAQLRRSSVRALASRLSSAFDPLYVLRVWRVAFVEFGTLGSMCPRNAVFPARTPGFITHLISPV